MSAYLACDVKVLPDQPEEARQTDKAQFCACFDKNIVYQVGPGDQRREMPGIVGQPVPEADAQQRVLQQGLPAVLPAFQSVQRRGVAT